jgi:hypothetical protein
MILLRANRLRKAIRVAPVGMSVAALRLGQ